MNLGKPPQTPGRAVRPAHVVPLNFQGCCKRSEKFAIDVLCASGFWEVGISFSMGRVSVSHKPSSPGEGGVGCGEGGGGGKEGGTKAKEGFRNIRNNIALGLLT